ncbi:MAG TPA: type II secretion system protein M [Steroidobacteraceae bacterium]|nr:type II secretion system protein M [Steroidobacteraceae bacterium]
MRLPFNLRSGESFSLGSFSRGSFSLGSLSPAALAALSPRERRMLLIGAIAAVAILIFGLLIPLDRSVARAQERLAKKRADLSWMQSVAAQMALLPPASAATGESLLVIVDRSAREAGLANALSGSEPGGPGNLSVRLEKAPFDVLVGWLTRLAQQNGVTVDSAIIEKSGAPGLVNASIVLHSG